MERIWEQQSSILTLNFSEIGNKMGLNYHDAWLVLFFPTFLCVFLHFSIKPLVSVRLFPSGNVFALFCVQLDKRKLTAGYFKLHRLLQFTRAVGLPLRQQTAG
jgi:hypothetical protein